MSDKAENKIKKNGRTKYLLLFTIAILLIGGGYGTYWFLFDRFNISTDNAYVSGNVIQITPLTSGSVASVLVDDTDYVKAGTVLVKLDKSDAEIALSKAEAELARTIRNVKTLYTSNHRLQAVINQRRTDLKKAKQDLQRRAELDGTGAISQEDIEHANETVRLSEQALEEAIMQLKTNRSLTANTDPENHPDVKRAAALVRSSFLALRRTEVIAPEDGYIARRSVQKGQWINTGTPLMALIPLEQIWVDANFKETQLRNMRIGQHVELFSDLLGSDIKYDGIIQGFSAGTGAAFSLLPAQNATGNWIKVVQRLPVRISLDKRQILRNPLQIGLSMEADVNVRNHNGNRLADGIANKDAGSPAREIIWREDYCR